MQKKECGQKGSVGLTLFVQRRTDFVCAQARQKMQSRRKRQSRFSFDKSKRLTTHRKTEEEHRKTEEEHRKTEEEHTKTEEEGLPHTQRRKKIQTQTQKEA